MCQVCVECDKCVLRVSNVVEIFKGMSSVSSVCPVCHVCVECSKCVLRVSNVG